MLAAPNGVTRRKLLAEHHAELERRIQETAAAKDLIEHALKCSADDFTRCPAFRHLAEASLGAVPIHTAGRHTPASHGSVDPAKPACLDGGAGSC